MLYFTGLTQLFAPKFILSHRIDFISDNIYFYYVDQTGKGALSSEKCILY